MQTARKDNAKNPVLDEISKLLIEMREDKTEPPELKEPAPVYWFNRLKIIAMEGNTKKRGNFFGKEGGHKKSKSNPGATFKLMMERQSVSLFPAGCSLIFTEVAPSLSHPFPGNKDSYIFVGKPAQELFFVGDDRIPTPIPLSPEKMSELLTAIFGCDLEPIPEKKEGQPRAPIRPGVVYIKTDETKLSYKVLALNDKTVCRGSIEWKILSETISGIPKDAKKIKKRKDQYLPGLLKIIAQNGHIFLQEEYKDIDNLPDYILDKIEAITGHSLHSARIALGYFRKQREMLGNSSIHDLIEAYESKPNPKNKQALINFLEDYRRVLSSFDDYVMRQRPKKASLKPAQDGANKAGLAFGEILNMVPTSVFTVIGLKFRDIFPPISYFFYGLASFIASMRKVMELFNPKGRSDPNLYPPRLYVKTTLFSAASNFVVCCLYAAVAVFLFSLLPHPYWMTIIKWAPIMGNATYALAMKYAAIGTGIGWIGNNVIDTWRLDKEYGAIIKHKPQFKDSKIFKFFSNQLGESYQEESTRLILGFFMVLGMAFLALNCVYPSPVTPVLKYFIEISCLKTAYISCFLIYASKEILHVIKCLGNCFGCCWGQEIDEQPEKSRALDRRDLALVPAHQLEPVSPSSNQSFSSTFIGLEGARSSVGGVFGRRSRSASASSVCSVVIQDGVSSHASSPKSDR